MKNLYQKLLTEWKSDRKNIQEIENFVGQLQMEFLKVPAIGTVSSDAEDAVRFYQIQRDVLEITALTCILKKDISEFQSTMGQLKPFYYQENSLPKLPESALKSQMIGLDLMRILAQNQIAEFHMELERIPSAQRAKDPYISTAVKLEQCLVEGAYNKLFLSKSSVPSPYYSFFIDILLVSVRHEIAKCIEKAHDRLKVAEAARLLFIDGPNSMVMDYGRERNWNLSPDRKSFVFSITDETKPDLRTVDAENLSSQYVFYAKQLETII